MTFLSKNKILRAELGIIHNTSNYKCWLKDERFFNITKRIFTFVRQLSGGINAFPETKEIEVLKSTEKKVVFRIFQNDAEIFDKSRHKISFIVKVFFLKHPMHLFKYHRYGFDEAVNLITAKKRGIQSPTVFGYAKLYGSLGLINANIVLMEDLHHLIPISEAMNSFPNEQRQELFMSTIPLMTSLYNACCNHIDIISNGVLLSCCRQDGEIALIDFQHAKFYKTPRIEIMAFECAYFAGDCRQWVKDNMIYEWFDQILRAANIGDIDERAKATKIFRFYFPDFARLLSRKQRKKIY